MLTTEPAVNQPTNSRKMFNQAIELLKENKLADAEVLCREAIGGESSDVNFIALLGTILMRNGKLAEAEEVLRRAVSIAPGFPRAQEDLGTLMLNLKRPEEALPFLEKATELDDRNAEGFFKLGGALKALGRNHDAEKAFSRSTELSPQKNQLAEAADLFLKRRFREAEKIAQELVRANPRDVNAASLLARIAIEAGCYDDAEVILRKVVQLTPLFVEAWHDLGTALKEQSKHDEAVEVLQQAIQVDPGNAASHYFHAAALAMAARPEQAESSYRRAIELNPKLFGAHLGLGHVLKTIGQQEEGIAAYRAAKALRPDYGETHYSLSNLKTFRFEQSEVDDMEHQLAQQGLGKDSVVHFSFALGKAYEDQKDFDKAFAYYERANKAHRETIPYDPVQTEIIHGKIRDVFSAELFATTAATAPGCTDDSPIFILGLPRSGSTLLEQILASHSLVEGTSELPDLSMVSQSLTNAKRGIGYPAIVPELTVDELTELGQKYIDQTMRHRSGSRFFTDKMPNNFPHIGFLQLILPNAKIIDARRHPLDSCMGCFKQHFAKGQTFTYDLFELGEFYLEYDLMMKHWDEVLPGKVLHVQYEDVVADLETQVRRILDYCGLPFEQACLDFHENERAVRTASSEQVRQPIYSGSVNSWKRFEAHLQPLIDILEPILPAET